MRMLLLLAAGCLAVQSQTASVTPAFEVASVKPASPPSGGVMNIKSDGGPGTARPERYTAENMDLAGLVMYAYDIKRFQISGPDWIRAERYDVIAVVRPNATKEEFRSMLQNLLVERFALKVHWETRELPIYELVVAKGGPKLEGTGKVPTGFPSLPEGKEPIMMMVSSKDGPAMAMRAQNESAAGIATTLSHQVDRPIRDGTGLKGSYGFTLYWLTSDSDSLGPTLFQAIHQQLGLKLEAKKGPVQVLVVDRIEKIPTPN